MFIPSFLFDFSIYFISISIPNICFFLLFPIPRPASFSLFFLSAFSSSLSSPRRLSHISRSISRMVEEENTRGWEVGKSFRATGRGQIPPFKFVGQKVDTSEKLKEVRKDPFFLFFRFFHSPCTPFSPSDAISTGDSPCRMRYGGETGDKHDAAVMVAVVSALPLLLSLLLP